MSWIYLVLAFACGFVMDLVWTLGVDAVQMRRPLAAANMGTLIYLCTIVSTVLIVEQCFLGVAAYIAGGWIGTYLVVRHRARQCPIAQCSPQGTP
jgi:hypothetical protein